VWVVVLGRGGEWLLSMLPSDDSAFSATHAMQRRLLLTLHVTVGPALLPGCRGYDGAVGQLGLATNGADRGDKPGQMGDALPAVALGSGHRPLGLALGRSHTCVLLTTSGEGDSSGNFITCFGLNEDWWVVVLNCWHGLGPARCG
jgi:hypothetical protein